MPVIKVDNLTKRFDGVPAVEDVSFEVDEGEILVIMGASGCGKTTTLRCLAGLERPSSGTIAIDERTMFSERVFVPPEKRGVGMVFQSYALWPHKTVRGNIAYSLIVQRKPKAEIEHLVEQAIAMVGLTGMADRHPATLSGGQQQRVALARAAVARPRVLLLDEPLSNLDAKLREQMRDELKELIKRLNITAVHITHDQVEAMALADRIICMRSGRIEQIGSNRDLYHRPASGFVADFIGMTTFVDGSIFGSSPEATLVRTDKGLEFRSHAPAPAEEGEVTLALRPEDVEISSVEPSGDNVFPALVTRETFLGDHIAYELSCGATVVGGRSRQDFRLGEHVFISIAPERVILLPRQQYRPRERK